MKKVFEVSPVSGFVLYRYQRKKSDGTTTTYPTYYARNSATKKEFCTDTDKLSVAKLAVKKLAGEAAQKRKQRKAPMPEVRIGQLLDLVLEDYQISGRKTIRDVRGKIEHSLRPFFGAMPADQIDSAEIRRWAEWRKSHRLRKPKGRDELSPASLNRELSILRRAFQLGYECSPQLVDRIPPIRRYAEKNIRKGFLLPEQYERLMEELPEHLRPITCVGYHTGNRKGELFRLQWTDVELDGNPPVFTLWPGETKNKKGRTLPIIEGQMMEMLVELKAERDQKWPEQTYVFLNEEGKPLQHHMMRKAWDDACVRAGQPGLLFHDLRRTGVRNLTRSGVPRVIAKRYSGHITDSAFERYDITDFEDLRDAASKLNRYLSAEREKVRGDRVLRVKDENDGPSE